VNDFAVMNVFDSHANLHEPFEHQRLGEQTTVLQLDSTVQIATVGVPADSREEAVGSRGVTPCEQDARTASQTKHTRDVLRVFVNGLHDNVQHLAAHLIDGGYWDSAHTQQKQNHFSQMR
jgi:hypothetical protein